MPPDFMVTAMSVAKPLHFAQERCRILSGGEFGLGLRLNCIIAARSRAQITPPYFPATAKSVAKPFQFGDGLSVVCLVYK